MSNTTPIEWAHVPGTVGGTWNPWHGCLKVSPGCKFCYMYRDKKRYGQDPTTVVRSKTTFGGPLKHKEPHTWFTCSWSDWFIEEADAWRDEAWDIIRRTPQHIYQILTKRSGRIAGHLPHDWPLPNVWLGVSVESTPYTRRIDDLLRVPAALHFVSYEPAIELVDFECHPVTGCPTGYLDEGGLDWIIVGGESGPEARMFHLDWARQVIRQCRENGVACFVKQLGACVYGPDDFLRGVVGFSGKGDDPREWPADLRVRQWPAGAR